MSHFHALGALPDPVISHRRKSGAIAFLKNMGVGQRLLTVGPRSTSFALVPVALALWPGQGMDSFSSRRLTNGCRELRSLQPGPLYPRSSLWLAFGCLTASVAVGQNDDSGGLLPLLREDQRRALSHQTILLAAHGAASLAGHLLLPVLLAQWKPGTCACCGQLCVSRTCIAMRALITRTFRTCTKRVGLWRILSGQGKPAAKVIDVRTFPSATYHPCLEHAPQPSRPSSHAAAPLLGPFSRTPAEGRG